MGLHGKALGSTVQNIFFYNSASLWINKRLKAKHMGHCTAKEKPFVDVFMWDFQRKVSGFGVTHVFFFSQGYTCSMEKTPFVLFRDQIKLIFFLNKRANTHTHTHRGMLKTMPFIHSFRVLNNIKGHVEKAKQRWQSQCFPPQRRGLLLWRWGSWPPFYSLPRSSSFSLTLNNFKAQPFIFMTELDTGN